MTVIEKSLNISATVKYVRVYEASRICGCAGRGECKFLFSTTNTSPPKTSYRRTSNNETTFNSHDMKSTGSSLESTTQVSSPSCHHHQSNDDSYYENSYISNLANYIKVLTLNDHHDKEKEADKGELLSPTQSDYRTCLESFVATDIDSPELDYADLKSTKPAAAEVGDNRRTLDDLIHFLDARSSKSNLSSIYKLQQTLVKLNPCAQLDEAFQLLNRELFNSSLLGVIARWTKDSIG